MNDVEVVTGQGRALTAAEFYKLADIPPEIEWFANLRNPNTRKAYEKVVYLQRADKSQSPVRKRPDVVKKENLSRTPGPPYRGCSRFTGSERRCKFSRLAQPREPHCYLCSKLLWLGPRRDPKQEHFPQGPYTIG